MDEKGRCRAGTSGWQYAHWKQAFYPAGLAKSKWFAHYASLLDTVELNATFYRLPAESAVEKWRLAAPPGFTYAVKASRYLTHLKRLRDPGPGLSLFFSRMLALGKTLGPVLFQLPPRFQADPKRLEAFLGELPAGVACAFEFRDRSWFTPEVFGLLKARGAALCVYDWEGWQSPDVATAPFAYLRLHGPGGRYQGSYSPEALEGWAGRMRAWAAQGRDAWCFFNNDQAGHAAWNAVAMRRLLED